MKKILQKIEEVTLAGFVYGCVTFVTLALVAQVSMVYVHFTKPEKESYVANHFAHKFDGTFKDDPENILYEAPKTIN